MLFELAFSASFVARCGQRGSCTVDKEVAARCVQACDEIEAWSL